MASPVTESETSQQVEGLRQRQAGSRLSPEVKPERARRETLIVTVDRAEIRMSLRAGTAGVVSRAVPARGVRSIQMLATAEQPA